LAQRSEWQWSSEISSGQWQSLSLYKPRTHPEGEVRHLPSKHKAAQETQRMTGRRFPRVSIVYTCWKRLGAGLLAIAVGPGGVLAQSDSSPTTSADVTLAVPHPLDPALKLARDSLVHIQTNVSDYTAIMTKRCRVEGELSDYHQMFVKIRSRRTEGGRLTVPMSVYMKYLRPDSSKGREVIWVEGRNNGKLVAHDTGLKKLFRVYLDPNGLVAMRGQRYPITEIGLEKLAQKILEKGEQDRKYDECLVKFYHGATVGQRPCRMLEIRHPDQRPHFDFYLAQVFFDNELNMPIRYASWSWPSGPDSKPLLEEEYTYTNVKVNVGLSDADFDPDNTAYDF
jgi:hypothetical protein